MTKAALYRLVCLLLAWTAYAANGAQAHIAWTEGETVAIPYCTVHGTGVLELPIGTKAPEATNTCCGDCTSPVALAAPELRVPSHVALVPVRHAAPSLTVAVQRTPLWPGAPPHGPPAHS